MKTAILITARLKSTRLPKKVIKPILGRPMICHMLDRLKLARRPDRIVICTSPLSQDDPLEAIAAQEGVACFRGDPDDVLLRLTRAAEHFGLEVAINCTADNPFVDPGYADRLLDWHVEQGNDYSIVQDTPLGTEIYATSYPAMVRACEIKTARDTEFWGGYFTQTGLFRAGTLPVTDPAVKRPELRLTVDTAEDLALVSRIFEALYVEGQVFSLAEIVRWCDDHPEAVALNAHIVQKQAKPIQLRPDWDRDSLPIKCCWPENLPESFQAP